MKIQFLRQLYYDYKDSFYLRKFFKGDHEEANSFCLFLKRFSHLDSDVEVPGADLLYLIQLLENEPKLKFLQKLKQELHNEILIPFYNLTQPLINAELMTHFTKLTVDQRKFFVKLLSGFKFNQAAIENTLALSTNEYFEKIISLADDDTDFKIMLTNKCLQYPQNLKYIYHVARYLSKYGLWQLNYLKEIDESVGFLSGIISFAHSVLNKELLNKLLINKNKNLIYQTTQLLNQAKILNLNSFNFLMNHQDFILKDKLKILKILEENNCLNEKIFYLTVHKNHLMLFYILPILTKVGFRCPPELIADILESKFDAFVFSQVLQFLFNQGILTAPQVTLIYEKVKVSSSDPLFLFLNWLQANSFRIDKEDLDVLFQLSPRNLERLYSTCELRNQVAIVNHAFIKAAINRVKETLPIPDPAIVSKISRKQTDNQRSLLIVNNKPIYIEHKPKKNYLAGGWGKIKKGYLFSASNTPAYAIKIFNKGNKLDPNHSSPSFKEFTEEAQREVKYRRFMNREAHFFERNNKLYLVTSWVNEKALHHFTSVELENIPIHQRFEALIYLLKELNHLHQHLRVHGDIKPANCVFDPNHNTLKLIDFGSAKKVGKLKNLYCTSLFLDGQNQKISFADDMYATGIIISFLFPEFYTISTKPELEITPIFTSKLGEAVDLLVHNLMRYNRRKRATSLEALNYCKLILDNINTIDEAFITNSSRHAFSAPANNLENFFRGKII